MIFQAAPRFCVMSSGHLEMMNGIPRLYVGHSSSAFLTDCGISTTHTCTITRNIAFLTLITFLFSQLVSFIRLIFSRSTRRDALVYVNTLLPFGAALARLPADGLFIISMKFHCGHLR